MRNLTPAVKNLLIINVIMFLVTGMLSSGGQSPMVRDLGLHYIQSSNFSPHQFITYMFLHGSFFHLLSNMFGLFIFGPVLERLWGIKRFIIYYFVTGVGAAIIQQLVWHYVTIPDFQVLGYVDVANHLVTIGASGALFGILLAFGWLFPNTPLVLLFFPFPIKAKYFVVLYGLFELYSGVSGANDGIAHFAHLGGMLFGIVLLLIWQKKRDRFY